MVRISSTSDYIVVSNPSLMHGQCCQLEIIKYRKSGRRVLSNQHDPPAVTPHAR
jgi:hypothetical protein